MTAREIVDELIKDGNTEEMAIAIVETMYNVQIEYGFDVIVNF